MSGEINLAEMIANDRDIRGERPPARSFDVTEQLRAKSREAWSKVCHASPGELAKSTARAWEIEASLASTATTRSRCLQAAKTWRERANAK